MSTEQLDAIIIGAGPAGLTSALALARQDHTVAVFDAGTYRNDATDYQHLILTWDHKSPQEFRAAARENIVSQYESIKIYDVAIESVKKVDGGFEAVDANGKTWASKKLVLATGVEDVMPDIEGFKDCWGKGIFHCFFYKGFESRGAESTGLLIFDSLTMPPFAIHAARHALQLTKSVTFHTNGSEELTATFTTALAPIPHMKVDSRKIKKLVKGPDKSDIIIHFEDGTQEVEAMLGAGPRTIQRGGFVEQLGLEMSPQGDIVTIPPFLQTSVKGVFAAGDNSSPMKIIATALSSGSIAGAGVSAQICAEKFGGPMMF